MLTRRPPESSATTTPFSRRRATALRTVAGDAPILRAMTASGGMGFPFCRLPDAIERSILAATYTTFICYIVLFDRVLW